MVAVSELVGTVVAVQAGPVSVWVVEAATAGSTVLVVDRPDVLPGAGTVGTVNDTGDAVELPYTAVDDCTGEVALSGPVGWDVPAGARLDVPGSQEMWAQVQVDDGGVSDPDGDGTRETVSALVPHALKALVPDGTRVDSLHAEQVRIVRRGIGWVVDDVLQTPASLDMGALPGEVQELPGRVVLAEGAAADASAAAAAAAEAAAAAQSRADDAEAAAGAAQSRADQAVADAAAAADAAGEAAGVAASKSVVVTSDSEPAENLRLPSTIWLDTTVNRIRTWDGTSWVERTDQAAIDAAAAAAAAASQAAAAQSAAGAAQEVADAARAEAQAAASGASQAAQDAAAAATAAQGAAQAASAAQTTADGAVEDAAAAAQAAAAAAGIGSGAQTAADNAAQAAAAAAAAAASVELIANPQMRATNSDGWGTSVAAPPPSPAPTPPPDQFESYGWLTSDYSTAWGNSRITAGRTYRFRLTALPGPGLPASAHAWFGLGFTDGSATFHAQPVAQLTDTSATSWASATGTFAVPADATSVYPRLSINQAGTETTGWWVTGLSIVDVTEAAEAQSTAAGKADVLIQSAAPSTAMQKATTLWIDTTSGNNTPKRWSGSAWVAVTDKVAQDAANAAVAAQNTANAAAAAAAAAQSAAGAAQDTADEALASADGKTTTYYDETAPSGAGSTAGDVWRQQDANGTIVAEWRWDGDSWVQVDYGSQVLRSLDVGKLTTGTVNAATTITVGPPLGRHVEIGGNPARVAVVGVDDGGAQYVGTVLGGVDSATGLPVDQVMVSVPTYDTTVSTTELHQNPTAVAPSSGDGGWWASTGTAKTWVTGQSGWDDGTTTAVRVVSTASVQPSVEANAYAAIPAGTSLVRVSVQGRGINIDPDYVGWQCGAWFYDVSGNYVADGSWWPGDATEVSDDGATRTVTAELEPPAGAAGVAVLIGLVGQIESGVGVLATNARITTVTRTAAATAMYGLGGDGSIRVTSAAFDEPPTIAGQPLGELIDRPLIVASHVQTGTRSWTWAGSTEYGLVDLRFPQKKGHLYQAQMVGRFAGGPDRNRVNLGVKYTSGPAGDTPPEPAPIQDMTEIGGPTCVQWMDDTRGNLPFSHWAVLPVSDTDCWGVATFKFQPYWTTLYNWNIPNFSCQVLDMGPAPEQPGSVVIRNDWVSVSGQTQSPPPPASGPSSYDILFGSISNRSWPSGAFGSGVRSGIRQNGWIELPAAAQTAMVGAEAAGAKIQMYFRALQTANSAGDKLFVGWSDTATAPTSAPTTANNVFSFTIKAGERKRVDAPATWAAAARAGTLKSLVVGVGAPSTSWVRLDTTPSQTTIRHIFKK